MPLRDFDLLSEFDLEELATLAEQLAERTFAAGTVMIRENEAADRMYFLLGGSVEVCSGETPAVLLASVDAGNVVGELALLGGHQPRTANVVAATAVRALELKASDFAPLTRRHPQIAVKLSIGVARALAERLRRANATIRSLTR